MKLESIWNGMILAGTCVMTYLTVIKEGVVYQNEHHNWHVLIYLLAMRLYYPLLILNFGLIALAARRQFQIRKGSYPLATASLVFMLNVALFSANNVANFLEGKPLHRLHKGILW